LDVKKWTKKKGVATRKKTGKKKKEPNLGGDQNVKFQGRERRRKGKSGSFDGPLEKEKGAGT